MAKEAVAQNSSSTTGTNTTVSNTTSTNTTTTNKTSTTSTSSSSSTRQYNDVATFDLKGNVKKCVYDGVTYEFDRNGKYKASANEKVIYDNKRRIVEIDGDKYGYDSLGRLNRMEHTGGLFIAFPWTRIYNYDSKGRIVKDIKSGIVTIEYEFSDYIDDSHGNWISRKRILKSDDNTKTIKTETETRTIEYY